VDLKYSMPVRVDAGDFRHLMLMQTCVEGSLRRHRRRFAGADS
jgi:hypothetical protein